MTVQQVRLHHFKASEFDQRDLVDSNGVAGENWYPHMAEEWLYRADVLRGFRGEPININRIVGSLGRRDSSGSQHNVNKWGEVRAGDVNIKLPENDKDKLEFVITFIEQAECAGFTGIAFYPDSLTKFFHLDVRNLEHGKPVAKWGRIGKNYVGMGQALEYYRNKLRG